MFRIFITFFLMLGLSSMYLVLAQDCGTSFGSEEMKLLLKNKQSSTSYERSEDLIYVPVTFHLAAQIDGVGRVPFDDVLSQLCELNASFEPYGYKFYLKNGTVNHIDNNTIYFNPSTGAGVSKMAGQKQEFGSNSINIFVTENADNGSEGTTLGYYTFNQDWIVLKKSVPQNSSQVKWVLAHEMGHFFSLPHTFNGWDAAPWDGTPVTSTVSPGGVFNELADGSNSDVAGDMIEDTPADYNLGFGWNGCAAYDGGCTDPTGALLDPDEENFMGYFIGCSEYHFSDKQSEIMNNDFQGSRRSYLRVSYQPTDAPVTGVAQVISPLDESTTPFYNGVELSWTPVENASHYYVELSQGLSKLRYTVNDSKLFLTDLKENKNYRWQVIAYNELHTCAASSPLWEFKTGTGTTSTFEESMETNLFEVFPNPSHSDMIRIKVTKDISTSIDLQLLSLDGKTIHRNVYKGIHASFIELKDLNINNGFYILRLKVDDKIYTRKVIINE